MSTLEQSLDAILRDPLRDALASGDAIGYVGTEVPLDVLLAADRPACHLPWQAGRATPQADRWLETGFPAWTRSILEDWHAGRFDALAQVVFTRGDDVSQRFYYYVSELQRRGQLRGPEPLIFDLALIPRPASLQRTADSIRRLAAQLGMAAQGLARGIARANRQRRLFAQLQQSRCAAGVLYAKIARASLFTDLSSLLEGASLPREPAACRVLLAGSAPPDERLHAAIEVAGAAVVADAHVRGLTRLGTPVDEQAGDCALAIARQLTASSIGPRSFIDRAAWLVESARQAQARAVVLWLTRDEEALSWHVPAQRAALASAGLAHLVLTVRGADADDSAGEEITSFIGGLAR
jgi:hypothetical protein